MFIYDKKLQYPVKIDKPNPRLASSLFRNTVVRTVSRARPCAICRNATACISMKRMVQSASPKTVGVSPVKRSLDVVITLQSAPAVLPYPTAHRSGYTRNDSETDGKNDYNHGIQRSGQFRSQSVLCSEADFELFLTEAC